MGERWSVAFVVAVWVTVTICVAIRRRARAASNQNVRVLGGLAVASGTIAGSLAVPHVGQPLAIAAAAGAGLATFGLLSDLRSVPPWTRVTTEAIAAAGVAAAGLRIDATGSVGADVVLTMVWLIAVTEGVRGLDFADGLAPVTVALGALGVFALSGFGDQAATATIAVATAGSCLGFTVFGFRPASVRLGDSGALFLGFALGALAIATDPIVSPPGGFVVPILLAGVPLLDLGVVTTARLRHGIDVLADRHDRVIHRLRLAGLSARGSFRVAALTQATFVVLAVFSGRDVLAVTVACGAGVLLTGAVVIAVVGKPVYRDVRRRRWKHAARRIALLLAGALLVLTAAVGFLAFDAKRHVDRGRAAVQAALAAAREGDTVTARDHFAEAADEFDAAASRAGNPVTWIGRVLPIVAPNLRAAEELAEAGRELAREGERVARSTDPDRLKVRQGTLPLAEVERLLPNLERAARVLDREVARIDEVIDRGSLVGPIEDAVNRVDRQIDRAAREAHNAVAGARLAPALFGGEGVRRYFLAVQNPAELRGTGGLIGNWGVLTAENGKVTLDRFERTNLLNEFGVLPQDSSRTLDAPEEFIRRYERFGPAQLWQNVNMSPDFPTVARVIESLFPQSGGEPIDGVIAVDPIGLAALLELTGPISVEGWPEPITPANVVDVTLRQVYDRFGGDPERVELLGDIAEATVDTATSGDLGSPAGIAKALGKAAHDGHFVLSFARPEEQALAERLNVAGDVPPPASDSVFVTTQNAAANKVDYYLRRAVTYTATIEPSAPPRTATVRGKLKLELSNGAPAGVPSFALGPWDERFAPGENRSFVSIYTPLAFSGARVNGEVAAFEADTELGRKVYSQFVTALASSTASVELDLRGTTKLDDGWYRVDLVRQPTLVADQVTLNLVVPEGWGIAEVEGLELVGARAARATIPLEQTRQVGIRIVRMPATWDLWGRLQEGT